MPDRRSFLTGSAAAGLATIAGPQLITRVATAQFSGPNVAVYNAALSAHSIASGRTINGDILVSDYQTLGNALNALCNDWTNNQIDAQLQPAWNALNPAFINNNKVDLPSALSQLQIYAPQTISSQLQAIQSVATLDNTDIEDIINNVQLRGMAFYFHQAAYVCQLQTSNYVVTTTRAHQFSPDVRPAPGPVNGACDWISAKTASLIGTAMGILRYLLNGINTLGIPPLAPLVGEFWAPLLELGGLAMFGWTFFKLMGC